MMTLRQRRILRFCNIEGIGLEIGASFNPIAPKKEGFHVDTMDYMTRENLIEKYRSQRTTPTEHIEELIEEVDYVWNGEKYSDLVEKKYDYIISSHLLEHVPDVIGHINDCYQILKEEGIYSLAIPDKRYCFDIFRKETTFEDMIQKMGAVGYSDASIIDYVSNIVKNGEDISWDKLCTRKDFSHIYSEETIRKLISNPKEYDIDIHVSVFTPESFKKIMDELYARKIIKMPLVYIDDETEYGEFFAVFKKTDTPTEIELEKRHDVHKIKRKYHVDQSYMENDSYVIRGFASINFAVPQKIVIKIGRNSYATTRLMRQDISQDINDNKYGFFAVIPISEIPDGIHALRICAYLGKTKKDYLVPTLIKKSEQTVIDLKTAMQRR